MSEPLRVTTDPDYFDQDPSSVELWSPGSPLFPIPDAVAPVADPDTPHRSLDAVLNDATGTPQTT
jgi:hypothetical protein